MLFGEKIETRKCQICDHFMSQFAHQIDRQWYSACLCMSIDVWEWDKRGNPLNFKFSLQTLCSSGFTSNWYIVKLQWYSAWLKHFNWWVSTVANRWVFRAGMNQYRVRGVPLLSWLQCDGHLWVSQYCVAEWYKAQCRSWRAEYVCKYICAADTNNSYVTNGETLSFDNQAQRKGDMFAAIAKSVFLG